MIVDIVVYEHLISLKLQFNIVSAPPRIPGGWVYAIRASQEFSVKYRRIKVGAS